MAANTHQVKVTFPNIIMIRLINIATELNGGSVTSYIRDLVYEDLIKRAIVTKAEYELMKELNG